MNNYLELGQKLIKTFPSTKGITTSRRISKEGLEELSSREPELYRAFSEITAGVVEPVIEIMQKAKGNYNIAAFRVQDKGKTLYKGAYSVSEAGAEKVEKAHIESDGFIIKTFQTKEKQGMLRPSVKPIAEPKTETQVDIPHAGVKEVNEILPKFIKPVFNDNDDKVIVDKIVKYIKLLPEGSKMNKPIDIFPKANTENVSMIIDKQICGITQVNLKARSTEQYTTRPHLELVFDKEGRLQTAFYSSHKNSKSFNAKTIRFENQENNGKIYLYQNNGPNLTFSRNRDGSWHALDLQSDCGGNFNCYFDKTIDDCAFERILAELTKKDVSIFA